MKFRFLLPVLLVLSAVVGLRAQPVPADSRVYELRIYTTNEGKFDDLLSRFRDHTMRLFERHGMRNIGYYTPAEPSEGGGQVLYYFLEHASREAAVASWAAFRADPEWIANRTASEAGGPILAKPPEAIFLRATDYSPAIRTGGSFERPRLFELRRYTAAEGKLPALHAFFRDTVLKGFENHGIAAIGFWDYTDAPQGAGREFMYLVAHANREAATKSWWDLRADAYFVSARAKAYADGSLTADNGVKSLFLVPVDFSPLK